MHPSIPHLLASLYLPGIGTRTIRAAISHFGDIQSFFSASNDTLATHGFTPPQIQAIKHPNHPAIEKALLWSQQPSHHLLTEENFPPLLQQISDPPLLLFLKGNPQLLPTPQLAIVGSRNASPLGIENAEKFAYHLAKSGFTITSGLALGIDGASHRGALNANGHTIAVTGTGLNHCYPRTHHRLSQEIIEKGGAIISEFPLDTPPLATNFPRRNRIISGLSVGVLVVEAAIKSGSMITVRFALEQGREVFAIPGSIHHPLAKGCHHLIRQGAKLVEEASDVVEELTSLLNLEKVQHPEELVMTKKQPENPEFQAILALIGYEMTPIDMILSRSRWTLSQVSSILLKLELNGYIRSVIGGYIRIT